MFPTTSAATLIEMYDAKIELPEVAGTLAKHADDIADLQARISALESVPPVKPDPPEPVVYPEEFKRKAVEYGVRHGEKLLNNPDWDKQVADIYYDADWVFHQLHEMTDDARFRRYSDRAYEIYMKYSAQGPAPYYVFTDGLFRRATQSDTAARDRILHLGQHGPYIPEATPLEWTANENRSRPVAYALRTLRHARLLGAPKHPKHDALLSQAIEHIAQWVSGTVSNFAPFMFGLTALELLRQHELWPDSRIPVMVNDGMYYTMRVAWRPDHAFCYRVDAPNAHLGTPDLNQLITPVMVRVAKDTGDGNLRQNAALAFAKGISSGYYAGTKQFNQLHANAFDYLEQGGGLP